MNEKLKSLGEAIAMFFIIAGAFIGTGLVVLWGGLIAVACTPFFWLAVIAVVLIKALL